MITFLTVLHLSCVVSFTAERLSPTGNGTVSGSSLISRCVCVRACVKVDQFVYLFLRDGAVIVSYDSEFESNGVVPRVSLFFR